MNIAIRPTNSSATLVDQYSELKDAIDELTAQKKKVADILIERLGAGGNAVGSLGKVTVSAPSQTDCDVEALRALADDQLFEMLTKLVFSPSAYNAMDNLKLIPADVKAIVKVTPKAKSLVFTAIKQKK